jgi:hypothetical protein
MRTIKSQTSFFRWCKLWHPGAWHYKHARMIWYHLKGNVPLIFVEALRKQYEYYYGTCELMFYLDGMLFSLAVRTMVLARDLVLYFPLPKGREEYHHDSSAVPHAEGCNNLPRALTRYAHDALAVHKVLCRSEC